MSCNERSQHTLLNPGCIKFKNCPSGEPTHVLCNIKEAGLSICTCSTQTPYSCIPFRKQKTNSIKSQLPFTVFDNCLELENSYSPDFLLFNGVELFIDTFCLEPLGILSDYLAAGGTLNVPSILTIVGPDPSVNQIPILEILSINPIVCNNLNAIVPNGSYTIANCTENEKISIFTV